MGMDGTRCVVFYVSAKGHVRRQIVRVTASLPGGRGELKGKKRAGCSPAQEIRGRNVGGRGSLRLAWAAGLLFWTTYWAINVPSEPRTLALFETSDVIVVGSTFVCDCTGAKT
jgi:hypothetical protein